MENLNNETNVSDVEVKKVNKLEELESNGTLNKILFYSFAVMSALFVFYGFNILTFTPPQTLDVTGISSIVTKAIAIANMHFIILLAFVIVLVVFGIKVYQSKDKKAFMQQPTSLVVSISAVVVVIYELIASDFHKVLGLLQYLKNAFSNSTGLEAIGKVMSNPDVQYFSKNPAKLQGLGEAGFKVLLAISLVVTLAVLGYASYLLFKALIKKESIKLPFIKK